MKKLIVTLTVAACAAGGFSVRADDERAKPPTTKEEGRTGTSRFTPQERMTRLTEALTLTPDQQEKIRTIWAEQRSHFEKARALPQDERREKVREAVRAQNDRISEVLTPEQKAKFKELIARRAESIRAEGEEE